MNKSPFLSLQDRFENVEGSLREPVNHKHDEILEVGMQADLWADIRSLVPVAKSKIEYQEFPLELQKVIHYFEQQIKLIPWQALDHFSYKLFSEEAYASKCLITSMSFLKMLAKASSLPVLLSDKLTVEITHQGITLNLSLLQNNPVAIKWVEQSQIYFNQLKLKSDIIHDLSFRMLRENGTLNLVMYFKVNTSQAAKKEQAMTSSQRMQL